MSVLPNLGEFGIITLRARRKGVIVVVQRDELSAVRALVRPLAGLLSSRWHGWPPFLKVRVCPTFCLLSFQSTQPRDRVQILFFNSSSQFSGHANPIFKKHIPNIQAAVGYLSIRRVLRLFVQP